MHQRRTRIRKALNYRLLAAAAATALLAGGTASLGAPAYADELQPDLSDPAAVLDEFVPGLTTETVTSNTDSPAAQVDVSATAEEPVSVAPPATEGAGQAVDITIDYATGAGSESDGITVFDADLAAAYVQPLDSGVRFATAVESAAAGSDFSYSFGVDEGAHLVDIPGDFTVLLDGNESYIGTLQPAWAIDANGKDLATSYSWANGTLTQHVEYESDTAFPVVLDPTWYYDYDFHAGLGGPAYTVKYPKGSEYKVEPLLRRCFNCYFPISGAPKTFPADGSTLKLNASPFSLVPLANAPVKKTTVNQGAMQFTALPGHFDGAGSLITFAWYNDAKGNLHLFVHAKILKDYGPANAANKTIAGANWLKFWQNVTNNIGTSGGGGGV